jgi:RNA polymerase sigma-70 factor, ECF subfamily
LPCDTTDPAGRPPFAAVVADHWASVYRLLDSLSGDRHTAEDLTQETFLRALDKWASFQPGTQVRAWLLRIATNAYFDERRKQKRSKAEPLICEPAGREPVPGHALETAERGARVREALAGLTDLTRLVFHLRAAEDLSFREIAELASTTEQSARWHMCHARSFLLEKLGEDF